VSPLLSFDRTGWRRQEFDVRNWAAASMHLLNSSSHAIEPELHPRYKT
jgi:hypothetical protein